MNKGKITPIIRFDRFTSSWERKQISSLMVFSNGINAPKENYGKGRKMISVMDILSNESISYSNIRSSVEVDTKTENNNKVEEGDIVFIRSSEVRDEVGWAKAYLDKEYALFSGFAIRGKKVSEFDALFLELSINGRNRYQIERKAGGSTRYNVSQSILKDLKITQPTLIEQKKISNLFKKIADIILLQQQLVDNHKQLKKAMLQKMFPQKGESVPRVRFAGFVGKWNKDKIENLLIERKERSGEGELISVTTNFGVVKATDLNRTDNSSKDKSNYKKVEKGDIAYNSMRMWQGASGLSKYTGIVSPAYTIIIPKEAVSPLFISYLFKLPSMIQTFQTNSQGLTSDTWNLKYPMLKNIKIKLPELKEQEKIGNFFNQLDETIDLHQKKLETYQEFKKAMLQKMFV